MPVDSCSPDSVRESLGHSNFKRPASGRRRVSGRFDGDKLEPPAIMAVGLAKSHFEKSIPTLGGSVLAGQLYLIHESGQETAVKVTATDSLGTRSQDSSLH